MVLQKRTRFYKERMEESPPGRSRELDDLVADLRRISLDNLQRGGVRGRRYTLRERLFPLSTGGSLRLRDVLYSESLWAAGTLVVCFLAYWIATASLSDTVAFVLVASLMMVPLLSVWAALGYYYSRKRERD